MSKLEERDAAGLATDATTHRLEKLFAPEDAEQFDSIKMDQKNFPDYERQFQEVLMTLENDEVLDAFRAEYAGLHFSFIKSHEGESRLLRKCVDLQSDIYTCATKAQAAEELALGDKETIDHLRAEIARTRKKSQQTREKESALREKREQLKRELVELERVASEPVEAAAQEAALQSLLHVHETVLKERDLQEQSNAAMELDIASAQRRLQKLRDGKSINDLELRQVRDAIDAKQKEVDELTARRESSEETLRVVRADLARRMALLSERQSRAEQLQTESVSNGAEAVSINKEVERLTETYQALCRQLQTTNTALQECNEDNDGLQRRVQESMEDLKQHQESIHSVHKQYTKESKVLEALQRRNLVATQKRTDAHQLRDESKSTLQTAELDLVEEQRRLEADRKQLVGIHRERDLLFQQFTSAEQQTQRNISWLAEKSSQMRHLEHELSATEEHAEAQKMNLFQVTKECMAFEEQTKTSAFTCATALAEVQARESRINELNGGLADVEARLKQQQTLLDSVIVDRNSYTKHASQLRNELTEMNRNFELVLRQIKQIKEDIGHRERELATEDTKLTALRHQQKEVETQILSYQRRVEKKQRTVGQFEGEVGKLSEVLMDAGVESERQRRRVRDAVHERDLLGNQAVQRAKELSSLYEKIHTHQALLERGEGMYRERVRHIEQLEFQCASLSAQLTQMQAFVARLPDLRLLVNNATRELSKEQIKVRALMDECERPLNLHPNHELAWSEPETYELLTKVRKLQRTLNERRDLLASTEKTIATREDAYMKAKATVARQPGPEVAEQISAYKSGLAKKQAQMQQMQQSLQYFREQTEQYRTRHEELRQRLADMAKDYASLRESEARLSQAPSRPVAGSSSSMGLAAGAVEDGPYSSAVPALGGEYGDFAEGHAAEEEEEEADFVYAGFVAPPLAKTDAGASQIDPAI